MIEFGTEAMAAKAVKNTNGFKLDKRHIFVVNHFRDVQKFLALEDNFVPPKIVSFVSFRVDVLLRFSLVD